MTAIPHQEGEEDGWGTHHHEGQPLHLHQNIRIAVNIIMSLNDNQCNSWLAHAQVNFQIQTILQSTSLYRVYRTNLFIFAVFEV